MINVPRIYTLEWGKIRANENDYSARMAGWHAEELVKLA
jgi:hypothetical protein